MNCEKIQAQLSDYLDRSLDAAQMSIVKEHLGACAICREESQLFNETVAQVAALPWIDPPLGFTQRVMAQVRELENQPGLWQRFSWALRQNLPIQATALAIVGILGIYLVVREEPIAQLTSLPPTEIKQDPKSALQAPPFAPSKNDPLALAQRAVEPSTKEVAPSRAPQPRAVAPWDRAKNAESGAEPSDRNAPMISGTPVTTHASSPVGRSPMTFSFPFESDTSDIFRSAPAAIEPFADFELIVRRHPRPADEPRGDVPAISRKAEVGKAAAEPSSAPRSIDRLMAAIPDHASPQTIWVNVPKDQYEQFKKELNALGTIESEVRVPLLRQQTAAHGDGWLRVRLMAVPATDSSTTSAPANR